MYQSQRLNKINKLKKGVKKNTSLLALSTAYKHIFVYGDWLPVVPVVYIQKYLKDVDKT
jgi:hypothetical protein